MFGLIIRGVFMVGILGWYSTSLWKMIDGYWRDQFQRYLDDEYQRNPQMRKDVLTHSGDKQQPELGQEEMADKADTGIIDAPPSHEQPAGEKAAGAADSDGTATENVPPAQRQRGLPGTNDDSNAGAAVEVAEPSISTARRRKEEEGERTWKKKEVARPVVGEDAGPSSSSAAAAFQAAADRGRDPEKSQIRMMQDAGSDDDSRDSSISGQRWSLTVPQEEEEEPTRQKQSEKQQRQKAPAKQKKEKKAPASSPVVARRSSQQHQRQQRPRKPKIGAKTEEQSRVRRKQSVPKRYRDDFEDSDDEDEDEGIALADLPYKPAVPLYDLHRLSAEEYCPLSLDDESGCDEARPWSY